MEALVDSSDLIFHGTVDEVQSGNLSPSKMPQLVTNVSFAVSRVLKGRISSAPFVLRLIGGKGKKHTLLIPGQPQFEKGEEVVLFLEWTGTGYAVVGLGQGKYKVRIDEEGRKMAKRNFDNLVFMVRKPGKPLTKAPHVEPEPPILLEELLNNVKQHHTP